MKRKILVISGSNSTVSINLQLAKFTSTLFQNAESVVLNLNDFEMPIYSNERAKETGIPTEANNFIKHIDWADLILISLAEHNGTYTAAFKNILDWISILPNRKAFAEKPMIVMATSNGVRGGIAVLNAAKDRFPFLGADVKGAFCLPSFNQNFELGKGITNPELLAELKKIVTEIEA